MATVNIFKQLRSWVIITTCSLLNNNLCWRPYQVEYTGSLLTSEVKQLRARIVLGWGTAWEVLRVLSAFLPFFVSWTALLLILKRLVCRSVWVSLKHRKPEGCGGIGETGYYFTRRSCDGIHNAVKVDPPWNSKLTWLVLGPDPSVCSCRAEQFTAHWSL